MNEQTELKIKEKLAREEFRLRSLAEADKVIAELEEKRDTAEKLLKKALDCVANGKNIIISLARKNNHSNYKRCLAMSVICFNRAERANCWKEEVKSRKRFEKWLELAEQFKDKEEAK